MCNLCKGKRVVHDDTQGTILFQTCPKCGPYTQEEQEARSAYLRERLRQHEIRLGIKSA